jgi:undecaprenyl-diphosphatase
MSFLHLISLAALQGLTEFLPVSSSGHLILFSKLLNFKDEGLLVDVALHIGSLFAVLIYFKTEVLQMLQAVFKSRFKPDFKFVYNKLAFLILIASVPALVVGFYLRNTGVDFLRNPKIIGFNILFYGILLYVADKYFKSRRSVQNMHIKDALFIGLAQCLALIPGTSRSGITITMARTLNITRVDAAKFSMLLSLPVIAAAGFLEGYRLWVSGSSADMLTAFYGIVLSFIASYTVICLMMKWLQHYSFTPFVIYRVFLGLYLLLWF